MNFASLSPVFAETWFGARDEGCPRFGQSVWCLWPAHSCSNSQETPTAISYTATLNWSI